MNKKLQVYLKKKEDQYKKKGFSRYKDVLQIPAGVAVKEIDRVSFLLGFVADLETKNKEGFFDGNSAS